MTPRPRIEPRPHWWKTSALTTVPSLLPSARLRAVAPLFKDSTEITREESKMARVAKNEGCALVPRSSRFFARALLSWGKEND